MRSFRVGQEAYERVIMKKRTDKFIENKKIFRCPVCRGKLNVTEQGSFLCRKKHCFDLAAKGYINLLTTQGTHPNKYDKNLFECRNRIFGDGFYDRVLEEILRTVEDYFPKPEWKPEPVAEQRPKPRPEANCGQALAVEVSEQLNILDVGCGEGFYANWLSRRCGGANLFGLDIVKEAIQIACREPSQVKWMVGNLADIPLFNSSFHVLLNVLTPANYKEFCRILKSEGILIKVVPGSEYLKEIRGCVCEQLVNKDYSNDSTVDYFSENMELLERRRVHYTLPVTEEQVGLFLQMTPMTFHVDTAGLPPERIAEIREITIHLELLIGRKWGKDGAKHLNK